MAFPVATNPGQAHQEGGVNYTSKANGAGYVWVKDYENPYHQYALAEDISSAYYEVEFTGDGTTIDRTIIHNLNTSNPIVTVRSPVTGNSFSVGQDFNAELAEISLINLNSLLVSIDPPIPNGVIWKVSILGLDLLDGITLSGGTNYISLDDLHTAYYGTSITGNGVTTSWPVAHDLIAGLPMVIVRSATTGNSFVAGEDYNTEGAEITVTSLNTLTVVIDPPIPNGEEWKIDVIALDNLDGFVGSGGGSGGGGVTDHGALTGRNDDDHAQYALADGSRGNYEAAGALAGHVGASNPHPQYLSSIANGSITLAKLDPAIGLDDLDSTKIAGAVNLNTQKLTNVGDATNVMDAVNKRTMDSAISAIGIPDSDSRVNIAHTTSGTVNLNWALGNMFYVSTSANITGFTESNGSNKIGALWIENTHNSAPITVAFDGVQMSGQANSVSISAGANLHATVHTWA